MINKFILFFSTVLHLKPIQVYYQLYYKFSFKKDLSYYLPKNKIYFKRLGFSDVVPEVDCFKTANVFEFLNLSKDFGNKIDWDFQGYGKLWNYNLQYCNFLNQKDIESELKKALILDIGVWLKNGRLDLEPYPVSLRLINIIRYLPENKFDEDIVREVYGQVDYLYKNLEYHILGNHLLENGFALLAGGEFFSNNRWISKAKALLVKELNEQILDDGAHFELSPMYHQIILFRVLELIDWYDSVHKKDTEFLFFLENKAKKMLTWLRTISFNKGDIPFFSDSADKIALTTTQLLEYAEALGLNSQKGNLKESGYRSFSTEVFECKVDVGDLGPSYQPGHGHADALSFVMNVFNNPFLVERGTSTYENNEIRQEERSTEAHNTITVDGKNQSDVWHAFRVGKRAKVKILKDASGELVAEHNGYKKIGVIHKRSFDFKSNTVTIEDVITGNGNAIAHFHLHPDCLIEIKDNRLLIDSKVEISFSNSQNFLIEDYCYAKEFNIKVPAKKIKVEFTKRLLTVINILR